MDGNDTVVKKRTVKLIRKRKKRKNRKSGNRADHNNKLEKKIKINDFSKKIQNSMGKKSPKRMNQRPISPLPVDLDIKKIFSEKRVKLLRRRKKKNFSFVDLNSKIKINNNSGKNEKLGINEKGEDLLLSSILSPVRMKTRRSNSFMNMVEDIHYYSLSDSDFNDSFNDSTNSVDVNVTKVKKIGKRKKNLKEKKFKRGDTLGEQDYSCLKLLELSEIANDTKEFNFLNDEGDEKRKKKRKKKKKSSMGNSKKLMGEESSEEEEEESTSEDSDYESLGEDSDSLDEEKDKNYQGKLFERLYNSKTGTVRYRGNLDGERRLEKARKKNELLSPSFRSKSSRDSYLPKVENSSNLIGSISTFKANKKPVKLQKKAGFGSSTPRFSKKGGKRIKRSKSFCDTTWRLKRATRRRK